jgi:pyrroloquinoline quinone (PQQ) biosynthesis protein C
LKTHYHISPKGLRFWDIHVEADAEHSGDGEMILNKYATTPDLQAKARRVALVGLEHRYVAMEAIYRRCGGR